jgi:hypothetical protein
MSKRFPVSDFRATTLIEIVTLQCQQILVNLYMPNELKISVRRKDLANHNSLYYMELMDCFQLMDTKVMDRIMKEYWWGKKVGYIKQLNANLQYQVTLYGARYRNTKSKLKASLEKHETTHHALLEQHSKNYTLAKQIKKDLMARAREGEVFELDVRINLLRKE